ncbi:hypothetical protein CFRS1_v009165 [Colletotrichum fructicola]|nr:hypothetical protein CFRS1_v009165 [Colletotrichum fructicola]
MLNERLSAVTEGTTKYILQFYGLGVVGQRTPSPTGVDVRNSATNKMSLDSSTIILHHGPRNVCRIRTLLALSLTSSSQSSSKPSSLRATRTSLSLLLKCHMNQNEYNCFDDLCLRVEHSGLASRGRSYRAPRRGMEDLSLKFSGHQSSPWSRSPTLC